MEQIGTHSESNTPINGDELDGLLPALSLQCELNEWELENIIRAKRWCYSPRVFKSFDPFLEADVRRLHYEMFCETWKWAGTYRKTEKNIGVQVVRINHDMAVLLGNARCWRDEKVYEPDELAIRYHHSLVSIHPFPNGNGRHARLIADILVQQLGRPVFTWAFGNIQSIGEVRVRYIAALQAADNNDFAALIAFARS